MSTKQYPRTNTNGLPAENLNVAVVGGGLVGSLLALHLGKKGHEVDLFEYREDIRTAELVVGRSINLALSARGRKALAEVGLEEALLSHGIPMRGRMLHDLKGNCKVVPYDANTNQCIYSVGRKHLNEVLLNAAEKYPNIHLHFNHKLQQANLDEGSLRFVDPLTKETTEKQADLIVGCDGAYSAVRKEVIKRPGYDFSQTYIEHGYLELCIPPTKDGQFAMPHNYLHIWPRGKFMNAGFEDCTVLSQLFNKHGSDVDQILKEFSETRWEDAHAICDLAMYNYIEMRDLVTKRSYLLRKKLDELLFWLMPNTWVPLYNSVSFSHMRYSKCIANRKWQDKILTRVLYCSSVAAVGAAGIFAYRFSSTAQFEQLSSAVLKWIKF